MLGMPLSLSTRCLNVGQTIYSKTLTEKKTTTLNLFSTHVSQIAYICTEYIVHVHKVCRRCVACTNKWNDGYFTPSENTILVM